MKRNLIRLSLPAVLVALALGTRAPALLPGYQVICPGRIPAGYLKVDVASSLSICGGTAWIIETYTNKSVGSAMTVCADQPTPRGWQELEIASSSGQCGNTAGNVKAIWRVDEGS
jgi:hypothetical protein